jgi:hypothetical protein
MKKVFNILPWLILITFWLVVLVLLYWYLYPYKPITFNKTPFPVETKIVKVGGILTYDIDYCKYNTIVPTTTKTFVDQIIYDIPDTTAIAKKVGCSTIFVDIQVPSNLPAGQYHLGITYHYQVNPVRKIDISVETEMFQVVQ